MHRLINPNDRKYPASVITKSTPPVPYLFQLLVKHGEYIYVRSTDIILIESSNHWVKVHLAFDDQIKKTLRHDTLKNFLSLLSDSHFIRLGRFCAVNSYRLSGGNYNNQTFEFDFKLKVKLEHHLPNNIFNRMGL